MDIFEAMVVEFGVVREERRQNVLDGIRALHGLGVVVLLAERDIQVNHVAANGKQVVCEIREQFCKFLETGLLETFVISD